MNKTVSVVLPVYNGMPYVKKAIDSVLAQSYPALELIVIDDGSRDDTPRLLAGYGDRIVTKRFDNAGVATAMSRGLEMARGDYVAFMDHDDVWFKDKLKRQMEAVIARPEAQFVCTDYAVRPPGMNGRLLKHFSKLRVLRDAAFDGPVLKNSLKGLLRENFVGTSTSVLVSRDVTRKVGFFNPSYKITGDYDYWLRCGLFTDFIVLREVLFYKRTHQTNISANQAPMLKEHLCILDEFMKKNRTRLKELGAEEDCRRGISVVRYQLGNIRFSDKKPGEAYSLYFRAWAIWPTASNTATFLYTFLKKSVRLATFGILSRKSFEKIPGMFRRGT